MHAIFFGSHRGINFLVSLLSFFYAIECVTRTYKGVLEYLDIRIALNFYIFKGEPMAVKFRTRKSFDLTGSENGLAVT